MSQVAAKDPYLPTIFSFCEDAFRSLTMGSAICTSRKREDSDHCSGKESEQLTKRRDTKDSTYDSGEFIECSSLLHSNRKQTKLNSKREIHPKISPKLSTKTE
ncbi:uncharacterized protein TNCV_589231 [Trichonephila clavipes]|nr:uncharacterized protein TNCV_589231 [Trichonephila clavipes]